MSVPTRNRVMINTFPMYYLWCKVALENGEVASLLDGIRQGADNVLALSQARQFGQVFGHGLASHCHAVTVDHTVFQKVLEHCWRTTYGLQVFHDIFATRDQCR